MGRYPSTYAGANKARKRLTAADVHMIHMRENVPTAELARQMGFSETTIHNVRVGNTWPELHPAHPSNQGVAAPQHVERTSPGYSEALLQDPLPDHPVAQANQETIQRLMAQLGGETPQVLTVPTPQVSYPPDISRMQHLPGVTLGQEVEGGIPPGEEGDMFGDNVV